ncbi:hypothetical protein [Marinithermofilum abyssi]|uniref:hypothetical protein n=1 Tax=Marinithermofilum abyssi TaxID=1571185 RepID=UPI0016695548|nr:hypothetical protein [Marinithermofilum abyssi]
MANLVMELTEGRGVDAIVDPVSSDSVCWLFTDWLIGSFAITVIITLAVPIESALPRQTGWV